MLDQLQAILPLGFGYSPVYKDAGNHLIIYSKTKNLPASFISAAIERLYGLPIPILLREDYQATRASSVEVLENIVTLSLPAGFFLRSISKTSTAFNVDVVAENVDSVLHPDWHAEITNCSSLPVNLTVKTASSVVALAPFVSSGSTK